MNYEGEKDLRVRTKNYAVRIVRMCARLPKTMEAQVLGMQVLRSGTSVGANYREAYRSRSDVEFAAKIGDCLKYLDETKYWLELISECNIFDKEKLAGLFDETNQLVAIFTTIVRKVKQRIMKQ
jgi:four helix bundle protein